MTGVRTILAKGGAVLAAALFVSPAAAQNAAVVLQPSSAWHVDYADDSCRLARQFGEGEQKVFFFVERYEPGDAFFMVVAGKPFETNRPDARTAFRFGPGGMELEDNWQFGELGAFKPALMATGMRLYPDPEAAGKRPRFDREALARKTDVFGQDITPPAESAITWLDVRRRGNPPVRLALGSMGEPMAAMRRCNDELMTHWGIDLAAHRGLTRAAAPIIKPETWITHDDYPTALINKGAQGTVQFRLSVGADGKPTQCHIQRSTRPAEFDQVVCDALMRRARFQPALGADGQPIATYWRNTVRFVMPN